MCIHEYRTFTERVIAMDNPYLVDNQLHPPSVPKKL